jgi:hypothetical protein
MSEVDPVQVYYSIAFLKFWGFDYLIPELRKQGDDVLIKTVDEMATAAGFDETGEDFED